MKHFALEEWADFVRNVGSPERLQEMQAHVRGCRTCQDVEALWIALQKHGARTQARSSPPVSSLHLLRAAFTVQKHREGMPRAVRFAHLIFDSFLDPLPTDVRASLVPSGSRVRQILFGAAPYVLDIRMEQEPDSLRVNLVGQVVHSERPENAVKDFSVFLRSDTSSLKKTISNMFGEFHFEFEQRKSLMLLVKVSKKIPICLPLPELNVRTQGGNELARAE